MNQEQESKFYKIITQNRLLILIVVFGFILRLVAALNVGDSADAMHFVTHAINFYSSGRLEVYDQSSGLWFAITSLFYKWFGTTTFSSHLAALIFGTASLIVIYLLAREFFDDKVSLSAAFLLAIAPFHLMNTSAEMDVMAIFFTLSSMLFFVRGVKHKFLHSFILSGMFLGLAIYTKVYPVLFAPSLLIFAVYYNSKYHVFLWKTLSKRIFLFCLVIFIFAVPTLAHNYLLYQDKGIVDLQFTRTFGIGENASAQYYGFDPIFGEKNDWKGFFLGNSKHGGDDTSPLLLVALKFIFKPSPIIFVLGCVGIILLLRRRKYDCPVFFFASVLFALPFLGSIILLPKHFLFLEVLLVIPAAFLFETVTTKMSSLAKKDVRIVIILIFLIITLLTLGKTPSGTFAHFYGESYVTQVIDFKENLPREALIVADDRIYRGQINWMFYGRPYLEAHEFIELSNQNNNLPGQNVQVDVYFVECVYDDCGWGTIASQQNLNQSMEELVKVFADRGRLIENISEPSRTSYYYPLIGQKREAIHVYSLRLNLKSSVVSYAEQPRNWFLYYIGYPDPKKEFDYYYPSTLIQKIIDLIAHGIVTIALILAFISPIYFVYTLIRESSHGNASQTRREDSQIHPSS